MSSKNRNVPVAMVRITRTEKPAPTTYREDVTVGMPIDDEIDTVYIRIAVKNKTIISDELNNFEWLEDSSSDGVVTLGSSSMQIIIIYDDDDRRSREFFAEMKEHLSQDDNRKSSPSSESKDSMEKRIDDLVQSIQDGSSKKAGQAAEYLAQKRSKLQFHLVNRDHDDNKDENSRKKPTAEAAVEVLELQLQVESHCNKKEPILATIYVRAGTKLCELKEQIEHETGIDKKEQYWLAFKQYVIPDEYEFGSDKPVVSRRPVNAPKKGPSPPKEPIKSGDTLIMCIAQLRPFH